MSDLFIITTGFKRDIIISHIEQIRETERTCLLDLKRFGIYKSVFIKSNDINSMNLVSSRRYVLCDDLIEGLNIWNQHCDDKIKSFKSAINHYANLIVPSSISNQVINHMNESELKHFEIRESEVDEDVLSIF